MSVYTLCALNEDGSEAAFVNGSRDELRIVDVDKVVGDKVDQSAIVTVKVPESLGGIYKLVYSDGNKLHVLHRWRQSLALRSIDKELISTRRSTGGTKDH